MLGLHCNLWGLLLLQRTGSRAHRLSNCIVQASLAVVHRLSCPMTCGIFVPHQRSNPHPLRWKEDSFFFFGRRILNYWTTREVPARVFLDKINIWISKVSNADCPPQCEWAPSNQLKTWIKQNGLSKREFLLPDCPQGGISSFIPVDSKLKHQFFLGLEPVGLLALELTPLALLVLRPLDSDWNSLSALVWI